MGDVVPEVGLLDSTMTAVSVSKSFENIIFHERRAISAQLTRYAQRAHRDDRNLALRSHKRRADVSGREAAKLTRVTREPKREREPISQTNTSEQLSSSRLDSRAETIVERTSNSQCGLGADADVGRWASVGRC